MANDNLAAIDDESKAMLEDHVKKGKARKFILITKGATVKTLIVFKKGPYGTRINQAKKDGFRGNITCGTITGKGVKITFKLPGNAEVSQAMKAEGNVYSGEPCKIASLRTFFKDEADLKFKPEFQLVTQLSEVAPLDDSDSDDEQTDVKATTANADSGLQKTELIGEFKKLAAPITKAIEAQPPRKQEILSSAASIKDHLQANRVADAEQELSAYKQFLSEIITQAPATTDSSSSPASDSKSAEADQWNRLLAELTPKLKEVLSRKLGDFAEVARVFKAARDAKSSNVSEALEHLQQCANLVNLTLREAEAQQSEDARPAEASPSAADAKTDSQANDEGYGVYQMDSVDDLNDDHLTEEQVAEGYVDSFGDSDDDLQDDQKDNQQAAQEGYEDTLGDSEPVIAGYVDSIDDSETVGEGYTGSLEDHMSTNEQSEEQASGNVASAYMQNGEFDENDTSSQPAKGNPVIVAAYEHKKACLKISDGLTSLHEAVKAAHNDLENTRDQLAAKQQADDTSEEELIKLYEAAEGKFTAALEVVVKDLSKLDCLGEREFERFKAKLLQSCKFYLAEMKPQSDALLSGSNSETPTIGTVDAEQVAEQRFSEAVEQLEAKLKAAAGEQKRQLQEALEQARQNQQLLSTLRQASAELSTSWDNCEAVRREIETYMSENPDQFPADDSPLLKREMECQEALSNRVEHWEKQVATIQTPDDDTLYELKQQIEEFCLSVSGRNPGSIVPEPENFGKVTWRQTEIIQKEEEARARSAAASAPTDRPNSMPMPSAEELQQAQDQARAELENDYKASIDAITPKESETPDPRMDVAGLEELDQK